MAEFDLANEKEIGPLVRVRIANFEKDHSGTSIYVSDSKHGWELRITDMGKKTGVAYITGPEGKGAIIRVHRPYGTIETTNLQFLPTLEGFILTILDFEEK
jgi:hypothetical protein